MTARSTCTYRFLVPCIATVAILAGKACCGADGWKLVLKGLPVAPNEAPLVCEIQKPLLPGDYALDIPGHAGPIPAQLFEDGARRFLAIVLPAGLRDGAYDLKEDHRDGTRISPGVGLREVGPNLDVLLDGSSFASYRTDAGPKPFLHPLVGPTGASFTRAFPMEKLSGEEPDHPHQRSLWFTHGMVNGIDFWTEQPGHGIIRQTGREILARGPVLVRFRTTDDWVTPSGEKVCDDRRVWTFYRTKGARIIDLSFELHASGQPVTFGDTKEGMFGLRVASSMDVDKKAGGRILNAEGLEDAVAWGKPSPWVDYSGPVGGRTVGIAILNHPASFRYPTTWHVRGYGLFAANPFGWHDFGMARSGEYTLPKGQTISFTYRVILHEGRADDARIGEAFASFAASPAVEVHEH